MGLLYLLLAVSTVVARTEDSSGLLGDLSRIWQSPYSEGQDGSHGHEQYTMILLFFTVRLAWPVRKHVNANTKLSDLLLIDVL